MRRSLLEAPGESGGGCSRLFLQLLKWVVGDETSSFGFLRVGDGMMDKCLLVGLPVGGRRMGWRDRQAILAALRVGGGGMEQATLVLIELVQGWRIMSGQPLE